MGKLKWILLAGVLLALYFWWRKRKADAEVDAARARRVAREPAF